MRTGYFIRTGDGPELYWSNDNGWVNLDSATEFTHRERETLNLPVGGEWVYVIDQRELNNNA